MKDNRIMTPDQQMAFHRSLDMLDTTVSELRRVAYNTTPEAPGQPGLDAALQEICRYVNSTGMLKLTCHTAGITEENTDKTIFISIYRIVQELLSNIIRHSGAAEASVQVTLSEDEYAITVADNGRGFDHLHVQNGMGLTGVRNRVNYLNGTMDIGSSAAAGTAVFIVFKKASS